DLALRGSVRKRMNEFGLHCRCIRCREYGHRVRDGWMIGEPWLFRMDYETYGGKEIFLSYEDANETLFGLLRLRVNSELSPLKGEGGVRVRELHVFGSEVPLGEKRERAAQHRGLGEKLLREAERIAQEEFHIDKLSILSGVGSRDYFRSLGYRLESAYMVKELQP
ncbi:MAG: GNAT family N-acetyltransferase, partial [Dehalococcoidia bacterium]|nr:GNAT family N-acetyltransferase [Dehalococcoidia bacterium]